MCVFLVVGYVCGGFVVREGLFFNILGGVVFVLYFVVFLGFV